MSETKTTVERALAALDDALADQIKLRFGQLALADEALDVSLGRFSKGLGELNISYVHARVVVAQTFKDVS